MKFLKRYVAGSLALMGCLGASLNACKGGGGDPYACVKEEKNPAAQAAPSKASTENLGQVRERLYIKSSEIWQRTEIPVCWEAETWALQSDADRALVREAVTNTWETHLAYDLVSKTKQVRFVGWEKCNSSNDGGIRITVPYGDSDNPHTTGLGQELAGKKDGMVLNFDFTKWSEGCSTSEGTRKYCLKVIAVHEFGHALGFAHEQNRPDTDRATCTDAPQGSSGNILMGPWDAESIMNYCNDDWNNGGEPSEGDILGLRAAYYPELYDFACVGEYKQRNAELKPEVQPSSTPSSTPTGGPVIALPL